MKTTTAKPAPARPHRAQPGENRRSDSKEASFTTAPAAPQERFTRWGATLTPSGRENASYRGANSMPHHPGPALQARRIASLGAAAKRVALKYDCRALVQDIQARASAGGLSARAVEKLTGLSRRTLSRIARGQGKLDAGLSRLRAAVAKLMDLQP